VKYYIFTYGCQMNKNDSEMVSGILKSSGWEEARNVVDSDLVVINTCSVRLHAEKGLSDNFSFKKTWQESGSDGLHV